MRGQARFRAIVHLRYRKRLAEDLRAARLIGDIAAGGGGGGADSDAAADGEAARGNKSVTCVRFFFVCLHAFT